MEIRFDGKVVLVTGASRGIGKATAEAFSQSGARVMVHFKSNKAAAESVIKTLPGSDHFLFQADLSVPEQIEHLVQQVIRTCGKIDILVNNAGIFGEYDMAALDYQSFREYWETTVNVNLRGPAFLSFLVAREMMKHGGGKIVNITSRGAFRGEPDAWAYGASKAGLNSLGQSMAQALASHNIFIFTLAPGYVGTDMTTSQLSGEKAAAIASQSPMKRVAQPSEIAQAIVMLAAGGNEYMTGCILDMNGASYLRM